MSLLQSHTERFDAVVRDIENLSRKISTLAEVIRSEDGAKALSPEAITLTTFEIIPYGYGSFPLNLQTKEGNGYLSQQWAEVSFCSHQFNERFHLSIAGTTQSFADIESLGEGIRDAFKVELKKSAPVLSVS